MSAAQPVKVLFVCLGNICRSPTAHAIFRQLVDRAGLTGRIVVDSAGTGDWHVGRAPDPRARHMASVRGYDLSTLRARVVTAEDFREFDYILGMDSSNMANMESLKPGDYPGEFQLFLSYGAPGGPCGGQREVPDPYCGGDHGFELVLDLVEDAAAGLLQHIRQTGLAD